MLREYPVTKVIRQLSDTSLLPAILFRTSRKQCDADIMRLEGMKFGFLLPAQKAALEQEIATIARSYGLPEDVITKHPHYRALTLTGTGAHHAGQLLVWRLVLEELMIRGFLRLMIATGTVAAGVDFPARTVVITAHSKRGSQGFNVITSSEFQQMSGRAGRRGKDSVGICLIAPSPYSDARVVHEIIKRPPEPLRSAYFAAPATVLNLLKYRNVDDLTYTVSRCLASFLDRKNAKKIVAEAKEEEERISKENGPQDQYLKKAAKRVRRKLKEAETLETRQIGFLNESLRGLGALGYVDNGCLTPKGYWASNLCTSLVLELGEAIADFLFDDLSVEQVTGLVASIAGDPHRPYFSLRPNPLKKEYFKKFQAVVDRVHAVYANPMTEEVKVLPDAALTVLTWMEAETWDEFASLIRLAGVAEGDVARLVSQTADHLNQLSRLEQSHPELARKATEGRMRILRPPLTDTLFVD